MTLQQKITNKLTEILKRPPTTKEIINGETDSGLRAMIHQDDTNAIINAFATANANGTLADGTKKINSISANITVI